MSENAAVATQEQSTALVQSFNIMDTDSLPNLHEAREVPVDLTSQYWTPEKEGDHKYGFYQKVEGSTYTDEKTGEVIELPCVIFIEQRKDRSLQTIRNGSKRLVAAIEEAENRGSIKTGTPLKITFLGKERNKTNAFMSDRWSVRPLSK